MNVARVQWKRLRLRFTGLGIPSQNQHRGAFNPQLVGAGPCGGGRRRRIKIERKKEQQRDGQTDREREAEAKIDKEEET